MSDIIIPIPGPTPPTVCDLTGCKCPCHQATEPWYIALTGLSLVVCAVITIVGTIWTIMSWIAPGEATKPTLVQVLLSELDWLKDLLGRIW